MPKNPYAKKIVSLTTRSLFVRVQGTTYLFSPLSLYISLSSILFFPIHARWLWASAGSNAGALQLGLALGPREKSRHRCTGVVAE
jgi:hypothetical protein